jgi:cytochrome P450
MTRSLADLPGPPRLPLIGNAHQMRAAQFHRTAEEWCRRYGSIFRFDIGPRRMVGIGDVDEINAILRDRPSGFRRWRELEANGREMTGTSGVFAAEGEDWRHQRRLVVTALNSNHLQRYFEVVRTATERLHRRLAHAAHTGQSLKIAHELGCFTLDVTSWLAFGHDLNTLEGGERELQGHIHRVFKMTGRRLAAPIPYWRWVRLPADRALDRSLVEIRKAALAFIEQARRRMASRPELRERPENFLEGMLAAQETDGSFTDDEIIGNVFTLLFAGEDTTAHTLAWTLWFLASAPAIQTRVAQEAFDVLGERLFPTTYETIDQLSYVEAVLRESMRLKPVAPFLGIEPLADTTIADTHIPAGTRLMLLTRQASLQAVERPDEFHPDRWLKDAERACRPPDQKSFLAFGAGPRFCPGRNLAILESKTALAMITRNFELELDSTDGPVTELSSFTMIPKGLCVRLDERASFPTSACSGLRSAAPNRQTTSTAS